VKIIESSLAIAFKGLCVVIMVAAPLLGVWLATSLASFHGGGRNLALAAGVMLFPILPALWELYSTRRWLRRTKRKERILTTLDRLILRTLAINAVFIGTLLVSYPKVAFAALATNGDWFIAERRGPWATTVRGALVRAASGLEWLHELANPNPYKKEGDEEPIPATSGSAPPAPVPTSVPAPSASESIPIKPRPPPAEVPSSEQGQLEPAPIEAAQQAPPDGRRPVGGTFWPHPNTVHPVLEKLTAEDERAPQTLADAIRTRVADPFERVKALHDWIVTRLRYDHESVTGKRRSQSASAVFESRLGVCEGYARLLKELGRLTGDRIAYVTGDVREEHGGVMPVGHAWNTVEIQGSWYIVDATWDDPSDASGRGDEDNYETTYLFIPPELAGLDHFPDDRRWQLRPEPLARAQFLRQPLARPDLAREGLVLVRPERPSVDVTNTLEITLENPLRRFVMLSVDDETCGVDDSLHLTLVCSSLRFQGRTTAHLFTNTQREGRYGSVASIEVTRQ
jgi:transglutaminase-like putative cysteine protease